MILYYRKLWSSDLYNSASIRLNNEFVLCNANIKQSNVLSKLIFARKNTGRHVIYTHLDHEYYSMCETVEHKKIRCKNTGILSHDEDQIIDVVSNSPLIDDDLVVKFIILFSNHYLIKIIIFNNIFREPPVIILCTIKNVQYKCYIAMKLIFHHFFSVQYQR